MRLLERVDDMEIQGLVLRAFRSASQEGTGYPVTLIQMKSYLEEELFQATSYDIEEYYSSFGEIIELNSFQDIKSEMIDTAGIKIPLLDLNTVSRILVSQDICFYNEKNDLVNSPQISVFDKTSG